MYVRITKSVKDFGEFIKPEQVEAYIKDRDHDWYVSPFVYGEDAIEYYKEHGNSIKGYKGVVQTDTLYWDLDSKDLKLVQEGVKRLIEYLDSKGYQDAVEVYFSGNKGAHVLLRTKQKFTSQQTSTACYNIALESKVLDIKDAHGKKIFDTTVYSINRIFRVENTKHPVSGLYKVPLTPEDFVTGTEEEIRNYAKVPAPEVHYSIPVEAPELLELAISKEKAITTESNVVEMSLVRFKDFNPLDCPPGKRRCIYIIENGHFGPGERENASVRLAAYYRGQNYDKETVRDIMLTALGKRSEIYEDLNAYTEEDVDRILGVVFSEGWNGGTYSCATDDFLASKCDIGTGPCCKEKKSTRHKAISIGALIDRYIQYGNEARKEYPKTGLEWVDKNIRIRPRNFSIINGANGSGKTSLAIQIMENLNEQKVPNILFSLDMADTSLFEKLGAKYTDYTQTEIENAFNINTRDHEIMKAVIKAIQAKLPMTYFDFTSSASSEHIEDVITAMKGDELNPIPIQVCIVDYAGRLTGDKDNDFANATANALAANDIAKRTDTHLMYVSQIPREDGDHTKPLYSSRVSKNSGAWEENATFVINAWRPFGDGLENEDHYLHLYIAKNRSGPLGEQVYSWEGKTGTISPISENDFDAYTKLCARNERKDPPLPYGMSPTANIEAALEKSNRFPNKSKVQYEDGENRNVSDSERRGSRSGFSLPRKG